MTDTKKPVEETTASPQSDVPFPEKRRRRPPEGRRPQTRKSQARGSGARQPEASRPEADPPKTRDMKATVGALRTRLASVVWLVAVVCALFLAVGALIVALQMNRDNPIVAFVLDGAHKLDFGEFKTFAGKDAEVKAALTNWGIAAVIYLVVGKVLDRLIRP